jgi:hypothetical protein
MTLQIVVVGGGAAGLFAAIACAEANPRAQVTVLEKSRSLLAKVRISGGGRCNVTHACFDPAELIQHYPRGSAALRGPFTRYQPRDLVDWFARRAVSLKTEADGRMFPVTDQSATIVDCLVQSAEQAGVELRTQAVINSITHAEPSGFRLHLKNGGTLEADRVLLATGSARQGYAWAAALGHSIAPPVPSLFTFVIDDNRLQGLAGVTVAQARAQLAGTRLIQTGPVLITHWGLSGPAILKLSAWGARWLHDHRYRAPLAIDWRPDVTTTQLSEQWQMIRREQPRQQVVSGSGSIGYVPKRLWQRLATAAGIDPDQRWADVSKMQLGALSAQLKQGLFTVQGKGEFKEEFVTCGGVDLDEVNFKTMESRRCPGLYFAGEILNIDGVTGGFNFQAAWTTGWLAGRAMAEG